MKIVRCIAWLALLAAGAGLLAGCAPPSAVSPGGATAPAAISPGPGRSTVTPAPSDTPVAALVTSMGTASVSSSLGLASPTSTPLPPLETAGAAPTVVTLADANRTIIMHTGDRFLLNLGEGAAWVVEIADPLVLGPVKDAPIPADSQGLFEARKSGATRLVATNEPACRQARPPCLLPTRTFEVAVVVD